MPADFENTFSKSWTISMLPSDYEALDDLSKSLGISKTEFCRRAIKKYMQKNYKKFKKKKEKSNEI